MKKLDSNFWKKYFKVYDLLNRVIPYSQLMDEVIKELNIKEGDLILDAGSGTGNLAVKLKGLGAKVIGLDTEEEAINIHKNKDSRAEVFLHDLSNPLPFNDNYFDKIVSVNTLYLLPREERRRIINEFFRCLKTGGKVVLSNPRAGASPIKIFVNHIQCSYRQKGFIYTLREIIGLIKPIFQLLHYNSIIKSNSNKSFSKFFEYDEQKLLLGEKFINIPDTRLVYAKQGILDSAEKPSQQNLKLKYGQNKIFIRTPRSQNEYIRSCKLIEKIYQEHGYIEYFQSNPSILFIALSNGDILGTIGLIIDMSQGGARFPSEEIFNFYFKGLIRDKNVKIAEISRLAAMDSQTFGLTRGLFLAIYKYVTKFNIDYCIASVKPELFDIIKNKLQIPIHKIDRTVHKGRVPQIYKGYFLHEPLPIPIYINTQETSEVFNRIEHELSGRIDLAINNGSNFDRITNYKNLN